MNFLAWDGEKSELYILSAVDLDAATELVGTIKEGSDGDEFSFVLMPTVADGTAVKITDLF